MASRSLVRLPAPRERFLASVREVLDEVTREVEEHLAPVDGGILVHPPGPKRWSAAHCLVHLTRTGALYRRDLSAAFEEAQGGAAALEDPVRGSFVGRLFAKAVGPDPKLRVQTPMAFRPDPEQVSAVAVDAFLEEQAAWRALLERAEGLPLDRIRVTSPVTRLLRLRASDALAVVANHEQRHLAQARAALRAVEGGSPT